MSDGCSSNGPPVDLDCADPAYRAAHPDECRNFTLLILKPEYSLVESGDTVTFHVFLRANGVEVELFNGLTWDSSNSSAAIIGPTGIATGVFTGSTTISVEWQNLSAFAQIDCVASCEDVHQSFSLLIDNSKSMGQGFSGGYPSKLAFSKSVASDFTETINYSKDQVSVAKFADARELLEDWTTDTVAARAAITSITTTTEQTNLADALQGAVDHFTTSGISGVRVIVLFSDGEYTGADPVPIARAFRESGGFLVVVATRAWGDAFITLAEMASGGFLLSAYAASAARILSDLSSLKSYMCSGDCSPAPGIAPHAKLNYTEFLNWDVVAGCVDLVGLDQWDVRPGNGLYVDMQGTLDIPGGVPGLGAIQSKDEFTFTAGEDYQFTISVGGSTARGTSGLWSIRIRVGDELDVSVDVVISNMPFTPNVYAWTPASTHTGRITIEQTFIPVSATQNVGTCIDEITLENLTTPETLLYDNFDSENPTEIPPSLGYYGGCATIEPQTADPTPPVRLIE